MNRCRQGSVLAASAPSNRCMFNHPFRITPPMFRPAYLRSRMALLASPRLSQGRTADGLDVESAVRIPLRDGVKLHANIYYPDQTRSPRPVILAMTPYMIDRYHAY